MGEETDLRPRVSVILPALMGYDSVLAALDSWEAQTRRGDMELLVLCPSAPGHPVPPGQVVVEVGSLQLHQARAIGIRRALADYILLAEDHCLPDPDCVAAILDRLEDAWDAVGPALRPGDRTMISQGSFLISYAQWMLPGSGPVSDLPGHNAVLRRQPLLDMGEELEGELVVTMFLMRRLRTAGQQFFVEERARMRHFDAPRWGKSLEIFYTVGQGFGAVRLRGASRVTRLLYGLMTPVLAARHFGRGLMHYVRAGARAGFAPQSIAIGGVFACAWAVGEVVGAWRGVERVKPALWMSEVKPVSRERAAV